LLIVKWRRTSDERRLAMSTVRWSGSGVSAIAVLALLSMVVLAIPCAASAQESEEGAGFMAAKGRVTYRVYCASCHGGSGKGDGSVAKYLKVPPSDLTDIRARHNGEFPSDEIAATIDGRNAVKAHGSREMPVWGDVFQSPLSETERGPAEEGEERAKRKIEELVLFLESIQVDP
jgi:mono/diheme cytochrome c family protein